MFTLLQQFQEYCAKIGVALLRDDINFLKKHLSGFPYKANKAILKAYANKWLHEVKKDEKSSQNQNLGRYAANKALLEYINACAARKNAVRR